MAEIEGWHEVLALLFVLVALGEEYANAEEGTDSRTKEFWLDEVIAFGDQDLCQSLGAGQKYAGPIEEIQIVNEPIVRDLVRPTSRRDARWLCYHG